ncbi:hypothetical protein L915_12210 [Phytophthora nicotianae]|uniref:Uncharacterized protein n=1 Tax=Phytophthora nicotianae TaxID=4792 RepID=W2GHJ3_PHYNI|nr:hypothetical protein L915_12210 [Phytophthora nicotianae]
MSEDISLDEILAYDLANRHFSGSYSFWSKARELSFMIMNPGELENELVGVDFICDGDGTISSRDSVS